MGFSPDARYFIASSKNSTDVAVAFDLEARTPVSLRRGTKDVISGGFAFTSNDRIIGANGYFPKESGFVSWPDGQVLERFFMLATGFESTSDSRYLLFRPFQKFASALLDIKSRTFVRTSYLPAMDVYGDTMAGERGTGALVLLAMDTNTIRASADLPLSPLGTLKVAAFSPDFRWVAVSGRTRASFWDVSTGKAMALTRGFNAGYFYPDGTMLSDMPKFKDTPRSLVKTDVPRRTADAVSELKSDSVTQLGPYLLICKDASGKKSDTSILPSENVILEFSDAATNAILWSKTFRYEPPAVSLDALNDTLMFKWSAKEKTADLIIKGNPALRAQLAVMKGSDGAVLLQVVKARGGEVAGQILIDTGRGSFRIRRTRTAGDYVIVEDSDNRVLVFSLRTGEGSGRAFGRVVAVAHNGQRICLQNGDGQLTIRDLPGLEEREALRFPARVSHAEFHPDDTMMSVLTAKQEVITISLAGK